ncbi:MAG: MmgE/PrpD family protein [Chloroflexota bacterium]|nr:MmgE/PrpD family protein [Chloroflexota bacterium]
MTSEMNAAVARPEFDERTAIETRQLAAWATDTLYDDLPPHVIEFSKQLILDHLGVAIGGMDHEATLIALDVARALGGTDQATVLGHGDRTSALNAAMVNGISSHVLDFDDTHIPTILHPTGPIMSAALALTELHGSSGRDLIRAHAVALEVSARASLAIFPEHYDAGWHMSGTTGTLGAAAAAAMLAGVSASQLVTTLGIAATQASGQREQFGAMTKSLHVGRAGANGVLAAMLAERGYTAAPDSLQGRRGMFSVMSTTTRSEALTAGLGRDWEIDRVGIKPYSCGVVAHPPIDAVKRLQTERGIDPDDVERIDLRVNPLVVELTGKTDPRTGLEGKFSVAFCAAIAMIEGAAGPRQFTDEAVVRPDVVALRDRIHPEADSSLNHSQAVATAHLRDGSSVTIEVAAASGTPENPLSADEVRAKFNDLVEPILGETQAAKLVEQVDRLDTLDDLDQLVATTVRGSGART